MVFVSAVEMYSSARQAMRAGNEQVHSEVGSYAPDGGRESPLPIQSSSLSSFGHCDLLDYEKNKVCSHCGGRDFAQQ
jgi:hypothetical protein